MFLFLHGARTSQINIFLIIPHTTESIKFFFRVKYLFANANLQDKNSAHSLLTYILYFFNLDFYKLQTKIRADLRKEKEVMLYG